ncbi:PREDICTED: uncharacterized protein LOC106750219 [Dinoponera quadriceps]|uniref:Uncharacterized protein LOC106750219 n=1 Tax=Dinoponera quadriceps TaxID=609295 RepID=A0A6P3Y772_DINQU|nr:PREDICTED: uncharacterized protein LOC106750219 [Dinoponera quadriceps]
MTKESINVVTLAKNNVMATNVTPICELVRILEKNVNILKTESCSSDIDLKFRDKLEWFGNVSSSLTDKLQSLLYLSENYNAVNNDLKQFVNGIVNLWISVNKQVCGKCSKIRMASRTLSGVPLSLLLARIKKECSLTKDSLNIHEAEYSREHVIKCCALLKEIEDLLGNLKRCDYKLRHYLAISKLIPFLGKLEAAVNAYVSTIGISPLNRTECTESDVFAIVVKLLTGELLGVEPMNPYHVLADNAPKKPVFIVKTKRRADIPLISNVET